MCGCMHSHGSAHTERVHSVSDSETSEKEITLTTERQQSCHHCDFLVKPSFQFCPNCGTSLREKHCPACYQLVDSASRNCPYCGYPLAAIHQSKS
uniref:DZANK-type domain-containing protein n=1 Tax=Bellilinea caldifistulae TaxID=360411 RepID=A0A7C4KZZ6_9CHLR